MILYVIYRPTTSDHSGKWVVRKHYILPGVPVGVPDSTGAVLADTLEQARAQVPAGLECIVRHPDDDPVIEETWL